MKGWLIFATLVALFVSASYFRPWHEESRYPDGWVTQQEIDNSNTSQYPHCDNVPLTVLPDC